MRDPIIKKLICTLLMCTAQTNFCMQQRAALTAPNDGQMWHEIKKMEDVAPFANKIVAFRSDFNLRPSLLSKKLYTIDDPCTFYGIIEKHYLASYFLIIFHKENGYSREFIQLNTFFAQYESQALFRLLTVSEMQHIFNTEPELISNQARVTASYCMLDKLTHKEQRRYVRDHSGIVTLLGIRAKRQSPLSVISKDVVNFIIIRQLMALETKRIGQTQLPLRPKRSLLGCGLQ